MSENKKFNKLNFFRLNELADCINEDDDEQISQINLSSADIKHLKNIISNLQNIDTTNQIIENNIESLKDTIERLEKKEEKDTNVIYIILGFIFAMLAFFIPLSIEWKLDPIEQNINSKFEIIQKELEGQKSLNQMQIERDVAIEIKNQYSKR